MSGIPAAEKYAEGPRLPCECHGEPMIWQKDARTSQGGSWQCSVKLLAAKRRHDRKRGLRPSRQLSNRMRARAKATEADLKLIEQLRHQLLGGAE